MGKFAENCIFFVAHPFAYPQGSKAKLKKRGNFSILLVNTRYYSSVNKNRNSLIINDAFQRGKKNIIFYEIFLIKNLHNEIICPIFAVKF